MNRFVLLIFLFTLFSCNTESNFDTTSKNIQLLRSISLNNDIISNFEYYPDNKIRAQVNLSGGAISYYTHFEYSNDTIYKTISGLISSKSKSYVFNDETIILHTYDSQDNLSYSYVKRYSSKSCGLSKTESYTQNGHLYTVTSFNYTDSNCSYNSRKESSNGAQKNNYMIVKDDKNNYKSSINEWPSFPTKHNIIEFKQWDANNNLLPSNSYISTFTYDENNYPIKETRTSLSGVTKIFTYEYY